PPRIARDHADRDVTDREVKRLRRGTGDWLEGNEAAPSPARLLLESDTERPRNPAAWRLGMHQEFPDFRPMGLIGRRGEIELHRAHDLLGVAGDESVTASC